MAVTSRTVLTITYREALLINAFAKAMSLANGAESAALCGQDGVYGFAYKGLQMLMAHLFEGDQLLIDAWDSNMVQGSLDLSSHSDYDKQISHLLPQYDSDIDVMFTCENGEPLDNS